MSNDSIASWILQDQNEGNISSWFEHMQSEVRAAQQRAEAIAYGGMAKATLPAELHEKIGKYRNQPMFLIQIATQTLKDRKPNWPESHAKVTVAKAQGNIETMQDDVDAITTTHSMLGEVIAKTTSNGSLGLFSDAEEHE